MGNPRVGLASLLRRWWLLILLATVGGAVAAYAYGLRMTPTYEANAQVVVEAPVASGGTAQAAELAPTYAEIVTSTPVLAFALRSTKVPIALDDLRADVRGESDQATRLIKIRVDNEDRADAVVLANALAVGLSRYVSAASASSTPGVDVQARPRVLIVDRSTSAVRVRPRSSLLLEFGAVAGLFWAFAFVLVAEARSPGVKDADELMQIGGLPVLGSVNGSPRALAHDRTGSDPDASACYRRLATQIAVANRDEAPDSLLVVGAEGAEDGSTVAAKLALAVAQEGRRVVLADFGDGDGIRRFFQIAKGSVGRQPMRKSKPMEHGRMILERFALRSGDPLVLALPRFDPRGLSLEEVEELVRLLSSDADTLIIYGPPPTRSRGALTWARAARATVLVVRVEHTQRANVQAALEELETASANLVGAVLQTG
jgi:polysaccharide biosynthesis transport protein